MNPAVGAIQEHDADTWSEKHENAAGGIPTRSKKKTDYVAADESEICSHAHTDKRNHGDGVENVSAVEERFAIETAETGYSDVGEGGNESRGGESEQIISFLIK